MCMPGLPIPLSLSERRRLSSATVVEGVAYPKSQPIPTHLTSSRHFRLNALNSSTNGSTTGDTSAVVTTFGVIANVKISIIYDWTNCAAADCVDYAWVYNFAVKTFNANNLYKPVPTTSTHIP